MTQWGRAGAVAVAGLCACSGNDAESQSTTTATGTATGTTTGTATGTTTGTASGGTGGAAGQGGAGGGGGAAVVPCTLTDSGPIVVSSDGEVIEELRITSTSGPAITVQGYANVIIRNVEILHAGGVGISISNSAGALIQNVDIEYTDAPASGANPTEDHLNISCYQSAALVVKRARLTRGSSGIYLQECDDSDLSWIEGHDFRGPFPRGQLVQWNSSDNGLLEDFSVENPATSWPEDNVNVYVSHNATIRRGLIDGNNSPSGVGVIFDGDDATGLVEDVDAIRMGNGCFSNYAGTDGNVFRRTRCRENICTDQGRGVPSSNALMWAGLPGGTQTRVEGSSYYAACNPSNIYWPASSFAVIEVTEEDFTLRDPVRLDLCWE